jgi:hypothetical protein
MVWMNNFNTRFINYEMSLFQLTFLYFQLFSNKSGVFVSRMKILSEFFFDEQICSAIKYFLTKFVNFLNENDKNEKILLSLNI